MEHPALRPPTTHLFASWQGELTVLCFRIGLGQTGRQPAHAHCEIVDLAQVSTVNCIKLLLYLPRRLGDRGAAACSALMSAGSAGFHTATIVLRRMRKCCRPLTSSRQHCWRVGCEGLDYWEYVLGGCDVYLLRNLIYLT